jgi:nucleoside-diphosphate-sugar epimerase
VSNGSEQRFLVTGASGFIGAPLVARLAAGGAEVHAVGRGVAPDAADPARWHALDLEDAEAVEQLVERLAPTRIYHLASRVVGRRELDAVLPTFRSNLAAAVHLLAAAARAGSPRVVLAGSMEEPLPGEPPASPYAAAKGAAALYARLFHALYGLPVVSARIFMVYGPGQRDATKLVPSTVAAALAGRAPRLTSGAREVDWIYVDDVVEGLVALGEAPGVEGGTYDLGTGELTTVAEVARRICALCGAPPPELGALPDRPLETVRRADPEATARACGWRARIGLDEGLARTVAALRDG